MNCHTATISLVSALLLLASAPTADAQPPGVTPAHDSDPATADRPFATKTFRADLKAGVLARETTYYTPTGPWALDTTVQIVSGAFEYAPERTLAGLRASVFGEMSLSLASQAIAYTASEYEVDYSQMAAGVAAAFSPIRRLRLRAHVALGRELHMYTPKQMVTVMEPVMPSLARNYIEFAPHVSYGNSFFVSLTGHWRYSRDSSVVGGFANGGNRIVGWTAGVGLRLSKAFQADVSYQTLAPVLYDDFGPALERQTLLRLGLAAAW